MSGQTRTTKLSCATGKGVARIEASRGTAWEIVSLTNPIDSGKTKLDDVVCRIRMLNTAPHYWHSSEN